MRARNSASAKAHITFPASKAHHQRRTTKAFTKSAPPKRSPKAHHQRRITKSAPPKAHRPNRTPISHGQRRATKGASPKAHRLNRTAKSHGQRRATKRRIGKIASLNRIGKGAPPKAHHRERTTKSARPLRKRLTKCAYILYQKSHHNLPTLHYLLTMFSLIHADSPIKEGQSNV